MQDASNETQADALADVQHDLARALTGDTGALPAGLLAGVVPGGSLDAAGALGVYRSGYVARLTEQLGETYATVWQVLGDEDFFALSRSYIASHPSASYNLSDYGREFPAFVAGSPQAAPVPMLAELAAFELVVHDLFHAPAHASMDAAALASLGDLAGVRMQFGSAVRLVACERAVYDVYRHRHEREAPDLDLERAQHVLLYKQATEVLGLEVDAATFAALEALAEGLVVEDALSRALECDPACGPAEVTKLFELIARCGLVASISR